MSRQALAARPPQGDTFERSLSACTGVAVGAGLLQRLWVQVQARAVPQDGPESRAYGFSIPPRRRSGPRGSGRPSAPEAAGRRAPARGGGRRAPAATWPPRTSAANWCPRTSNPPPAARRPVRTGRSIALPVLAELLGLGTTTATRWAAVAGRELKPVHGHAPSGSDASTKAAGVLTGAGQPARAPAGPANQLPADDARSRGIARRHRPANGLRVVGSQFAGGGQFVGDAEHLRLVCCEAFASSRNAAK